jgi:hypothetical protein
MAADRSFFPTVWDENWPVSPFVVALAYIALADSSPLATCKSHNARFSGTTR